MLPVADVRIVTGAPATIRAELVDQEGDPITPGAAVTVGVVDLAGAQVIAPATATGTVTTAPTVRTIDLPATADLDLYTATWTDGTATTTTTIEVAGRHYAGPAAIRASDPALTDPATYPDARLIQARRAVEDEFERVIGYALVPRVGLIETRVDVCSALVLPHLEVRSIVSATLDGTAIDTELDGDTGAVTFDGYAATGLLRIVYTHGLDRPTGEALEAFYTRTRDVLHRDTRGLSDRMTTFTSDIGGTYALAVAGRNGSMTGIPDVDVVLRGLARRTPGIA
jgi:hypothetical protein